VNVFFLIISSFHQFRNSSPYSSDIVQSDDPSIHNGNEFRRMHYNPDFRYNLTGNVIPDTRMLVPGVPSTPRTSAIHNRNDITRIEAGPTINLDLSLSVILLDMSHICGVLPLLTYQYRLFPPLAHLVKSEYTSNQINTKVIQAEKPTNKKSIGQFALEASLSGRKRSNSSSSADISSTLYGNKEREVKPATRPHASASFDNLYLFGHSQAATDIEVISHQNTSPLQDQKIEANAKQDAQQLLCDGIDDFHVTETSTRVSESCGYNARIASFAGRSDLSKMWSLLEISTSGTNVPDMYKRTQLEKENMSVGDTFHPWNAHPFGKGLVKNILDLYEKAGDVPTLASIVCTLNTYPDPHKNIDHLSEKSNAVDVDNLISNIKSANDVAQFNELKVKIPDDMLRLQYHQLSTTNANVQKLITSQPLTDSQIGIQPFTNSSSAASKYTLPPTTPQHQASNTHEWPMRKVKSQVTLDTDKRKFNSSTSLSSNMKIDFDKSTIDSNNGRMRISATKLSPSPRATLGHNSYVELSPF